MLAALHSNKRGPRQYFNASALHILHNAREVQPAHSQSSKNNALIQFSLAVKLLFRTSAVIDPNPLSPLWVATLALLRKFPRVMRTRGTLSPPSPIDEDVGSRTRPMAEHGISLPLSLSLFPPALPPQFSFPLRSLNHFSPLSCRFMAYIAALAQSVRRRRRWLWRNLSAENV